MKHLFYSTLFCICCLIPQKNYSMERSQLQDESTQTYVFYNMLPEQQHQYQSVPQEENAAHRQELRPQTDDHPSVCCYCCPCVCIGCCSISILGLLLAGSLGLA